MANKFDLGKVLKNFEQVKRQLPDEMANLSLRFFQNSFRISGWNDGGISPWRQRKRPDPKGRKLLVVRGNLKRSVQIKSKSFERIVIGSYLKYSEVHNEGFSGVQNVPLYIKKNGAEVKAHSRRMTIPKRQFMGESRTLKKQQIDRILKMIDKGFKQ
jgi:phage gpG-like protein